MADYIKIPSDLFDTNQFKVLEPYENGDAYICLYLKLLMRAKGRSEKGFEYSIGKIDMTDTAIRVATRYPKDDISRALSVLTAYGMIERSQKAVTVIPFWRNPRDRNDPRYRLWRTAVFKRDNFTCQCCGSKKDLQAHHIISWKDTYDEPELRYEVSNGITLCRKCHLKAHNGRWY